MSTSYLIMKIETWLKQSEHQLEQAGIGTARLDILVLLQDVLCKDKSYLLAHPETKLDSKVLERLDKSVQRRTRHEPLAYIRGKTEFYGREFVINKNVLEPRPESETMIDLLKSLDLSKTPHIADVGTGSGALGITAALEIPGSTVELIDIDDGCLKVARQNCVLHKVTAQLYEANLIARKQRDYDVILANLPYVPDDYTINEAAAMEPKIAIFGGTDGLDIYRKLLAQIVKSEQKPEFVLTESLPFQHLSLAKIAETANYRLSKTDDFIQLFEIIE